MVSPNDALIAFLKIRETLTRNICDGVSFPYSYRWTDWTARIAYKKLDERRLSANLDVFKTGIFPNIPLKMYELTFFISFKILDSNISTLIK